MTDNKTSSPAKGAANRGAQRTPANRPPQAQRGPGNPQAQRGPGNAQPQQGPGNPQGQRRRGPSTIDETIAKAQTGRVNITPAKAVEMAGQLYTRRQYAQAIRVCRQIIASRPGNADAKRRIRFCYPKKDETLLEAGRRLSMLAR